MRSLLAPLPETLDRWAAAGHPDPFVEVRHELTCVVIGTLETLWDGPASPLPVVRVRAVVPSPLAVASMDHRHGLRWDRTRLERAIAAAERARRRSIRPCALCDEPTPPEHGERDDEHGFACHGCMERHLGVVF